VTVNERISVTWTPRDVPLAPRAVAAVGEVSRALGRRLAMLDDASLRALAALASRDVLVVVGDENELPWIDGVTYLGRDESAPDLLLPTAMAPSVPPAILEMAVKARCAGAAPVAVLSSPSLIVPCGEARSIDRARLMAWLGAA
jgi:hypothetical protein